MKGTRDPRGAPAEVWPGDLGPKDALPRAAAAVPPRWRPEGEPGTRRLAARRVVRGPSVAPGTEPQRRAPGPALQPARVGRVGWTPRPGPPLPPHTSRAGAAPGRSRGRTAGRRPGSRAAASPRRLPGRRDGAGGRGGRDGARRAHHQNFGRVLQLSDHFWGPQRRRHHGLSSMTRHALHSGSRAAAGQSARRAGGGGGAWGRRRRRLSGRSGGGAWGRRRRGRSEGGA